MFLKKLSALVASALIVSLASPMLAYADVLGETKVKYFTPEVLFDIQQGDVTNQNPNENGLVCDPESNEPCDSNSDTAKPVDAHVGIENFVKRLYNVALDRDYDPDGLVYWCDKLEGFNSDGLTIFRGFTVSDEFIGRNLTNDEYITILYKTFFDREPDEDGFKYWEDKLVKEGQTRDQVLQGFANSYEWANMCASFGILSGGTQKANIENPYVSEGCKGFVTRLYNLCLDREPEEAGLEYWTKDVARLNISGKECAKGFFESDEFTAKAALMEDEDLITLFYMVFLDREPEEEGMEYWLERIQLGSRVEVLFNGVSDSYEFKDICDENGIYAGPSIKMEVVGGYDEDFLRFVKYYGSYGMEVLEEGAKNLQPKLTYKYSDVKGSERIDKELEIPVKDIAAIEKFFDEHFNENWTVEMKAAYCFYWIHQNMIYAYGGVVAPTYCVAALEKKYGQCAQYNGSMVEILCYLGYDACLVRGTRGSSAPGSQHYWGELYVNEETYVIEVGNDYSDGSWNYFFVPYSYTKKFIICGVVQG